jgi:putative peptidoglycan lipid II flippase
LGKVFGLVAILTVLSKVAGLARDVIVLQFFGTSLINDAYNYAYLLTGNILVLFGGLGGPFHSSTVAILTPRKDEEGTGRLVGQITVFTIAVLTVISAAAWLAAPYLVSLIAPAHGHPEAYRSELWSVTTHQLRFMLPIVVITGVVGISYGVLNVYGKFFWPSLSPAIASLAIIVAVLGFAGVDSGTCLAVGTLVGAVGQMVAQLPGVMKSGLKWGISLKPQPGLSDYFSMLWPAVISTSVGQLTVYVDCFFTSQLHEGSWTAIVNANRLIQLPLGVLLTAMLVPILPRFTEQVAARKIDELKAEFRRALSFLWFLSLPLTALLCACPTEMIRLLFQRGHFDQQSTQLVTAALIFMVPSIFFYVARDLITRVFYAHHDSTTPYHVALMAIVVKGVLDWALVGPLGVGGISLATTFITIFNLSLLAFFLKRKIGHLGFTKLVKPLSIMLIASTACGGTAYGLKSIFALHFDQSNFMLSFASLAVSCSIGLVIYGAICTALRLEEPLMLLKRLGSPASSRR